MTQETFSNFLNVIFAVVSITLFIIAIILHRIRIKKGTHILPELVQATPTLLVTIGILGTFVGIFIGLVQFDQSNLTQSIPKLLAGMKLAFLTSVVGMILSILFKLIHHSTSSFEDSLEKKIYDVLSDINTSIQEGTRKQERASEQLQFLIQQEVGKSNAVIQDKLTQQTEMLVTHLQTLNESYQNESHAIQRTSLEQSEKLIEHFVAFTEKVSEKASKAMIDALRQIIQEFNKKISQQLGDDFQQFRSAVRELNQWQQSYKDQLVIMIEQFRQSASGIETVKDVLTEITEKMTSIPLMMSNLQHIIEIIDRQIQNLEQTLASFVILRNQASEAFPVIETNLNKITIGIENAISTSLTRFENVVKEQNVTFQELSNGFQQLQQMTVTSSQNFHQQIQTEIQEFTQQGQSVNQMIGQYGQQMLSNLDLAMKNSLALISTNLETQKTVFDDLKDSFQQFRQTLEKSSQDFQQGIQNDVHISLEQINQMIQTFEKQANTTVNHVEKAFLKLKENAANSTTVVSQEVVDVLSQMKKQTLEIIQKQDDEMLKMFGAIGGGINDAIASHEEILNQLLKNLEKPLKEKIVRVNQALDKQFSEFDEKMEKEITREIEIMCIHVQAVYKKIFDDLALLMDGYIQKLRN